MGLAKAFAPMGEAEVDTLAPYHFHPCSLVSWTIPSLIRTCYATPRKPQFASHPNALANADG